MSKNPTVVRFTFVHPKNLRNNVIFLVVARAIPSISNFISTPIVHDVLAFILHYIPSILCGMRFIIVNISTSNTSWKI
ncbi:hypothetical protein BGZ81_001635 [Podila clonocystis]|nr:hypothetical protein BGZ81_001635 [Podila clonocystis]